MMGPKINTSTLLVMRCETMASVVESIASFEVLDEVRTSLLVITGPSLTFDQVSNLQRENVALLASIDGTNPRNITERISNFSNAFEYVCFLPQHFKFCRSVGIHGAIELMESHKLTRVFGIINGPSGWNSAAFLSDPVNSGESLFCTPIEMAVDTWKVWGPYSYCEVDFGGDLVVCRIDALPDFLPAFIPGCTWGILLQLFTKSKAEDVSVVYSGLHCQIAHEVTWELGKHTGFGARAYSVMKERGLFEIVFLGRGKLVCDDDFEDAIFQESGVLDVFGNPLGAFPIGKYYKVQAVRGTLGPLYSASEHLPPFEKRLHKPGGKRHNLSLVELESKIEDLQSRSVDNFKLNRLWEVALKRSAKALAKKFKRK
ncbi:hypothetical protein [Ruegeria sp. HU-ET01832]|uniref:hypothetical protein n=1 Tax=Ruegeria sp. HU-ET01832 TaxID=3135906 RepID=UPI003340E12D